MKLEIVSLAKREYISPILWPLLNDLINAVQEHYSDRCTSIYLLGSACTGKFLVGSSDLDVGIIVSGNTTSQDYIWLLQMSAELISKFSGVTKIDVKQYQLMDLQSHPDSEGDRIVFKTEGLLLRGKEILPDYTIPDSPKIIARALAREKFLVISTVHTNLSEEDDATRLGQQLAKQFIRLVYYVALARGKTTYIPTFRELHIIAKTSVPDFQDHLEWAERLLANPPTTFEKLKRIYDDGMHRLTAFKIELL